jgi:hypothetical protein
MVYQGLNDVVFLLLESLGACCDVFAEEEAGGLYSMNGNNFRPGMVP